MTFLDNSGVPVSSASPVPGAARCLSSVIALAVVFRGLWAGILL